MQETGYNGWTNYETWVVKLWIDNDQGSYNYWRDEARTFLSDDGDHETHRLASQLREEHDAAVADFLDGPATFVNDLVGAAMSDVDWHEIASSLIAEVVEEDLYLRELATPEATEPLF